MNIDDLNGIGAFKIKKDSKTKKQCIMKS